MKSQGLLLVSMKRVELGNFKELWEAVSQTEPFEICMDESCVTAPGWGTEAALFLGILELTFWWLTFCFAVRTYRKRKRRKIQQVRDHP